MAEFVKHYREKIPALRLIGKKYGNEDRVDCSFGAKWGEWFANNWFEPLESLPLIDVEGEAYVGAIRCGDDFEYWIGMLCQEGAVPPEGYDYVDMPAGELAVVWVKGREDDGLYTQDQLFLKLLEELGWPVADQPWFYERYVCPRFTQPDENGEVVLDYCIYIKQDC